MSSTAKQLGRAIDETTKTTNAMSGAEAKVDSATSDHVAANVAPKALVVDDDMVALIVVKHMLESAGLEVTQAANVRAARGHLETEDFDIIIADYLMPDATGLELLVDSGGLPFVLLSGVIERGDQTDPRLSKVTAHLTKPVSTEELRSVVMTLLPQVPSTAI